MTVFEIGDRVEGIDEIIRGIVLEASDSEIVVESEDGFMFRFHPSELIRIPDSTDIKVSNFEVVQIKREKELPSKIRSKTIKSKDRNAPKMEVDLHINQLVKSVKGLSNYEMLNIQMDFAKRQLEFAIRKRIQKVVFIHGVGEGILREELYYLFGRYENVKYHDADYQKYGLGATEVYIFQNL